MVTHESAIDLERSIPSLKAQMTEGDALLVVDNASSDDTVAIARRLGADVLETGRNLGFAGGCNAGASATEQALLAFVNPDAVVQPGCLDALREAAREWPRWGAWQALITMDGGTTINSWGNVVHYLGFGWAGGCGRPASDAPIGPRSVGFASGAALVVRRAAWEALGGFDERYFMYGEDLDLGLRLRLAGWESGIVPGACVDHGYEFAKGAYKWFYLERNRAWTVLGAYPLRLLVSLAPALLAFEAALLVAAAAGGWLRPKLRADAAVLRELPAILRRRRQIQRGRVVDAATFAGSLSASLDFPELRTASRIPGVDALQRAYFRWVRSIL